MGTARFTQQQLRVFSQGAPKLRVTQQQVRVVSFPTPAARVTQQQLRVFSVPVPAARITQQQIRVLSQLPVEREQIWDVQIGVRWDDPYTRVEVYGAADELGNLITATAVDTAAEAVYGVWSGEPISSEAIGTTAMAQALADAIIREKSTPRRDIRFLTPVAGLEVGQQINVRIPSEGIIDEKFLVRGVEIEQRDSTRTVWMVDVGEIRPNSDELLAKIEEAFRRQRARRTIAVRCLEFTDGTLEGTRSDTGDVPIQDLAVSAGTFAVSAWIFPFVKDTDMTILAKGAPEGGSPKGWTFRQLAVEGFELRIAKATTQEVRSSMFGNTVMDVGKWHHVYIDRTQCWVDGVLQTGGFGVIDNPGSGAEISDVGEDVRIGTDFEGCLADVRLYNQELGERAIKGLASQPHSINNFLAPLVWWKCDDYEDGVDDLSTLFDSGGGQRFATLNAGDGRGEILTYQVIGA